MLINDVDKFPDLKVIKFPVYQDRRGFFTESFKPEVEQILGARFVQDNHSCSRRGVVRGIHYQWQEPMGKLVRVVNGSILDFAVDLRANSPTFGQYHFEHLSMANNLQFWVPPGFGHAFIALEDNTHVTYKCSSVFNSAADGAINPLDPDLNIHWPMDIQEMILSDKDRAAQSFQDYKKNPRF